MSAELQDKLIGWVIRAVTAAATGTGVVQVTSSTWIGRRAYESFLASQEPLGVTFLHLTPFPPALFEAFGASVLMPPELHINPVYLLLLSAPLLGILGHVVYRGNLEDEGGGRVRRLYRRLHFAITLLFAVGLVAAVAAARSSTVLLVSSALVALGVGLYLILYCGDLRQKGFLPRFVWIALALVFFANLFALPHVHGERFFDLQLLEVAGPDGSTRRFSVTKPRLEAMSEPLHLLFEIAYDEDGKAKVAVDLTDDLTGWRKLEWDEINLRELLQDAKPSVLRTEEAVDREVETLFQTIGVKG